MAYFWLNQREQSRGYSDIEGEVYNYRSNVPGSKKLSAGDRFVYYRPGEYTIFGGGVVSEIETEDVTDHDDQAFKEYYAYLEDYHEFDPPIQVRELKNEISFLRDRDGLRGVPQNSIYEISADDFRTIVETAGVGDSLLSQ